MKKVIKASGYRGYVYDDDEREQAYTRAAYSVLHKVKALRDVIEDAPRGFVEMYGLSDLLNECLNSAQYLSYELGER